MDEPTHPFHLMTSPPPRKVAPTGFASFAEVAALVTQAQGDMLALDQCKNVMLGSYSAQTADAARAAQVLAATQERARRTYAHAKKLMDEEVDWRTARQMHVLWVKYARRLLECGPQVDGTAPLGQHKLHAAMGYVPRMDFHGAHFVVTQAPSPKLVGLQGVCVCETKRTITLCCPSGCNVTLRKAHLVVRMNFPLEEGSLHVFVNFNSLQLAPALRATRSFKEHREWM